jgi:hypothetical protein
MRFILKVFGLSLLLVALLHGGAFGQTKPPIPAASALPSPDPMTLDVAGVRLGMTVDEAVAALQNFDAGFSIKKDYLSSDQINGLGADVPASARFNVTSSVTAVNESYTKRPTMGGQVPGNPERILVEFSLVPAQERVVSIYREVAYVGKPQPYDSIYSGILGKYPKEITIKETSGYDDSLEWMFDIKKRIISPAIAKSRFLPKHYGTTPNSVSAGGGTNLSVRLFRTSNNKSLVDRFLIAFFDEAAIYKSIEQKKSLISRAKAARDMAELEKSKNQGSQTKF